MRDITTALVLLEANWARLVTTRNSGAGGFEPRLMLVTVKPPRLRALIRRVKLPAWLFVPKTMPLVGLIRMPLGPLCRAKVLVNPAPCPGTLVSTSSWKKFVLAAPKEIPLLGKGGLVARVSTRLVAGRMIIELVRVAVPPALLRVKTTLVKLPALVIRLVWAKICPFEGFKRRALEGKLALAVKRLVKS